jgi:membrane-associated phospholipid phosphatase
MANVFPIISKQLSINNDRYDIFLFLKLKTTPEICTMKQIFRKNLPFFIPYIVIWLSVLIIVLSTTKLEQMQWINSRNAIWKDWFFYGATQLGEGWFWAAMIILFLFIGFNKALIMGASLLLSTLISSTSKLYFDTLRPIGFFEKEKIDWHFVDGVVINLHQSFPSGHTTTAFAIFTMLTLFTKNRNWGFLFVLLAWFAGYSRTYLFQHFPVDVLGGAVIGVFSSILVYYLLTKRHEKYPKDWHQRSLLRRKRIIE